MTTATPAQTLLRTEIALLRDQLNEGGNPVEEYRACQGPDPLGYQLPEPVLHPVHRPKVLVVGFNPNFDVTERIPRITDSDTGWYERFYAGRFEEDRRLNGRPATDHESGERRAQEDHYGRVEDLLIDAFRFENKRDPEMRALGAPRGAVYCDAFPWKWPNGEKMLKSIANRLLTEQEWIAAAERIVRIAEALEPRVVLSLGGLVGDNLFGRKPDANPHPRDAPGPRIPATSARLLHVASFHPGSYGYFYRHRAAVIAAIQNGLEMTENVANSPGETPDQ